MKNVGLITLLLVSMGIIAGCNSGGGGGGGSSGAYQINAFASNNNCSQIGSLIYESVTYSASVVPAAYFQRNTTSLPEGVKSFNTSGNCSASQISESPSCTYTFTYESTTQLTNIQIQLNGSLGPQNIAVLSIGGSCIK